MRRLLIASFLVLLLGGCFTPPWTATTDAEYIGKERFAGYYIKGETAGAEETA